jgi:DeoR/GlpR family transcriptional regulator of sugar metabolism
MEHLSMRYSNAAERREWIMRALATEGFLSVADIVRELGVSHMTVRRDLQHLEETGRVRTVRGAGVSLGAGLGSRSQPDAPVAAAAAIGGCAARLVGPKDVIAVDAGPLGYEIARHLADEFTGTVVTHSIPVIQALMARPWPPQIVGLGGELAPDPYAFVGASTAAAVAEVRVQTLFLGADAVDDRGAYAHSEAEASVKRALVAVADRVVLVTHQESFTKSAPLLLGVWARIGTLVSDRSPPEKIQRGTRKAGVELLVAGSDEEPGGPS